MAASWDYIFQYALNQIIAPSIFNDPFQLIMYGIWFVDAIFLAGLIRILYKNYKKTDSVESLLFMIGLLLILTSLVFFNIARFCYESLGSPGLGDLLYIITQFPVIAGSLCFNIFAVRVTFPKRSKIVFSFVLVLGIIFLATITWAVIQGPPYANVVNFDVSFSLNIVFIRLCSLLPILTIPAAVFFYYAIRIRNEDKPKSTTSLWLGLGIVFFAIAFVVSPIAIELRYLQAFVLPAPIIFYICFSMPDWFKRKIGRAD
ncbi:MAG: hypothetical protein ACFFDN_06000 [Candidatus Hodarchaeota archaeon]